MLASASLPLKAEEANKDKAMSALARLLARKSSSSLLAGGRWGPLAGARRPAAGNSLRPGGRAGRPGGMPAQCTVADAGLVR